MSGPQTSGRLKWVTGAAGLSRMEAPAEDKQTLHPARAKPCCGWQRFVPLAARWILGAVFIYMGIVKVLHPIDFLKLIREYQTFDNHLALNAIAGLLPWFEI